MSNNKTQPTHSLSFAEKKFDENGREKLGRPVEVATVWPRNNGKKGGMLQWHISPKNLGDGAYFLLENERDNQRKTNEKDAFTQTDTSHKERDSSLSR